MSLFSRSALVATFASYNLAPEDFCKDWRAATIGVYMPPNSGKPKDKGDTRPWTKAEVDKLAQDYNARLPGICPVCASEVSVTTEPRNGQLLLLIRCRTCRNWAEVASP